MIIENVLNQDDYAKLSDLVLGVDFPWYYQPDLAFRNTTVHLKNENVFPSWGFTHIVWDTDQGKVSEVLDYVAPIVDSFTQQTSVKINNFSRVKINLQVPIIGFTEGKHNGAHIDRFEPHKTLIYYLNDSDGDTYVFNEIFDPDDENTWLANTNLTVKERITPVANSMLYIENGFNYHSGSNPINTARRFTINLNFD